MMSCGLLLASTSICTSALAFPAGHSRQCMPRFPDSSLVVRLELNWTFFPNPYLLELFETAHMLDWLFCLAHHCLVPIYTPFLFWQHCRVDSWDSASHWDMLWLAPPYALFPWMAGPVGSTWSQWVCPLLFPEWLSWLRFASCQASAG